jgi:hypothetical protein
MIACHHRYNEFCTSLTNQFCLQLLAAHFKTITDVRHHPLRKTSKLQERHYKPSTINTSNTMTKQLQYFESLLILNASGKE